MQNKRGQVWIETVIYTLITFVMIGLVLSFVKPKIEEIQDKVIIDKTRDMFNDIDNTLLEIREASGNQRVIELGLDKGTLIIDGITDKIIFEMESNYVYSQPGENISYGNLIIYTKSLGKKNIITLTEDYSQNYNITYGEIDREKTISKSPTPYKLLISNKGESGGKVLINILSI